jgi:hypothetical protein
MVFLEKTTVVQEIRVIYSTGLSGSRLRTIKWYDCWWIGNNLEGSAHSIIEALSRYFSWEDWVKTRKAPSYKYTSLSLYYSAWVQVIKEFYASRSFIFFLTRTHYSAQSRGRPIPQLSACWRVIWLFNTAKINSRYSTLFVTNYP